MESFTVNMNEFVPHDEKLLIENSANPLDRLDKKEIPPTPSPLPVAACDEKAGQTAKRWRYGVFFVIWLLVAWPLLTVREKDRIEHVIAIDSTSEKSIENAHVQMCNI